MMPREIDFCDDLNFCNKIIKVHNKLKSPVQSEISELDIY